MKKSLSKKSGNVSFEDLLVTLFIGLKMTNHIAWSWWWVFSPFWAVLLVHFLAGVAKVGNNK
jgi:hypothetical protein